MAWELPTTVDAVNARQEWRKHITSLLDSALQRNDAVLEQVSAAMATAIEHGSHVYAFGAGHSLSLVSEMHRRAGSLKVAEAMAPTSTITGAALIHAAWAGAAEKLAAAGHVPEVWGSVNRAPSIPNP